MATTEPFDVCGALYKKWDADQRKEAAYHVHPENQEGASGLGGCIVIRSKREAGIKIPRPTGAKADFGAMYAGTVWHEKGEGDLVTILQHQYPDCCVGAEIVVETEIIPGKKVLSPVDIAMATKPGFVTKTVHYRNEDKDVQMLAPGAKFLAVWDIKSCSSYAFGKYQQEAINAVHAAQGLAYLKAMQLDRLEFIYLNKENCHLHVATLAWSDAAWLALQAKRQRELDLATEYKATGKMSFVDTDFLFNVEGAEDFYCAYCPLSEVHEEEGIGKTRVILDLPCPEVVARKTIEYTAKFQPGTHWMSGLSMLAIDAVRDGKVFSHNKGGKSFEDTIFRAGKTYVEGWEKKEKPVAVPVAIETVAKLHVETVEIPNDQFYKMIQMELEGTNDDTTPVEKPAAKRHAGTIGLGVDAAGGIPVKKAAPAAGKLPIKIITRGGVVKS